jgi:hypothetical protein
MKPKAWAEGSAAKHPWITAIAYLIAIIVVIVMIWKLGVWLFGGKSGSVNFLTEAGTHRNNYGGGGLAAPYQFFDTVSNGQATLGERVTWAALEGDPSKIPCDGPISQDALHEAIFLAQNDPEAMRGLMRSHKAIAMALAKHGQSPPVPAPVIPVGPQPTPDAGELF